MPTLPDALASPDHRVRLLGLKAALDANDRSAPDVIVASMQGEENAKVRNAMALVVGKLGEKAHAPALARLLRDPDAGVRLRAVEGIVALKDSATYPALVATMVSETDQKVRDACAHNLMKLGGDKLIALFLTMLRTDVGWMKEAAVLALALFNSPRVVPLLQATHARETGPLQELAFRGLERLAGMGNELAKKAVEEIRAQQAPRLDVDFANLDDDSGDLPGQSDASFEDTYTGGKLPRIEPPSPLEDDEEPEAAPAPAPVPMPGSGARAWPAPAPTIETPPPPEAILPSEPPPPPPAEPPGGSAKRPRPVMVPAPQRPSLPEESFDGGMVAVKRPGEDEMKPCPHCGAEISAGARRCRKCNEPIPDESGAIPTLEAPQPPFHLVFVAVLSLLLGGMEAHYWFTTGAQSDAALGVIMGILYIVEMGAAVGAGMGYAWAWYLWWPLAFFLFMVGASHTEVIAAGRSCACLISLSTPGTRDYCVR